MPRRKTPRVHAKAQRRAFLEKQLVVWKSQLRTDHEKMAELEMRVAHAERMLGETQRELDEIPVRPE